MNSAPPTHSSPGRHWRRFGDRGRRRLSRVRRTWRSLNVDHSHFRRGGPLASDIHNIRCSMPVKSTPTTRCDLIWLAVSSRAGSCATPGAAKAAVCPSHRPVRRLSDPSPGTCAERRDGRDNASAKLRATWKRSIRPRGREILIRAGYLGSQDIRSGGMWGRTERNRQGEAAV